MLAVTETAQSKIHEIIQNESDLGNVIRVVARKIAPYRFDYDLYFIEEDEIESGDVRQEINGLVFVADAESSRHLEGASIDYVEGPPSGFKFENPHTQRHFDDPKEQALQKFIDDEINPKVAAHGGYIGLDRIEGDAAYLEMGGACQGCGMAAMTMRQGVEAQIFERFPEIARIVDVTNHSEGKNPFYQSAPEDA